VDGGFSVLPSQLKRKSQTGIFIFLDGTITIWVFLLYICFGGGMLNIMTDVEDSLLCDEAEKTA
jgi:hypothetical protein